MTEEKFGSAEKTELDAHFESLADRAECTKVWTEKLVRNTEAVLTPNPGNRAEDFIFEKIEKKKPVRLSNLEYLGLDMIEVSDLIIVCCVIILMKFCLQIFIGWRRIWPRKFIWKRIN